MKRKDWPVKNHGIRPAGEPDECFYCGEKLGNEHKKDCVIRQRTIVLKLEMEIVIDVPEFWDRETVEFHYNEGSWCSSNMDIWLTRMEKHKGCLCHFAEFTYLREATEDDEEYHGLFIKNLPT
jgi:hypothetical protein